MYFKTTYEPEFEDLYMYLKSKYPQKLFDLEGIGIQTDMGVFSKNFFGDATTTADASVDANSNVDDMTVVAYENELPKPFTRMILCTSFGSTARSSMGTSSLIRW